MSISSGNITEWNGSGDPYERCLSLSGDGMDVAANLMIPVPLFLPSVVASPGVDSLWWRVILGLILCLGYRTPPFGMSLFCLRGGAPQGVTLHTRCHSIIAFCIVDPGVIVLCMAFPIITTWLPSLKMKQNE